MRRAIAFTMWGAIMPNPNLVVQGETIPQGGTRPERPGNAIPVMEAAYVGMIEIWRIVRRHRTLVIGTVVAIFVLTAFVLTRMTPVYTASTVVMVKQSDDDNSTTPDAARPTPAPDEELRIASELELLQSRSLAKSVAGKTNLIRDPEFAPSGEKGTGLVRGLFTALGLVPPPPNAKSSPLASEMSVQDLNRSSEKAKLEDVTNNLLGRLAVVRLTRSNLISISLSSNDPFKAALLANRWVDTYIDQQVQEQQQSRLHQIADLTQQANILRTRLQGEDMAVTDYMRAKGLDTATPGDINNGVLARISGALAEAKATNAASGARVAAVAGEGTDVVTSPTLTDLRAQEATLSKKLAELTSFYGTGYPEVVNTQAQLGSIRRQIGEEYIRAQTAATGLASIENRAVGAQAGTLSSDLSHLRATNMQALNATVGLKGLQRQADTSHQLYLGVLAQLKELSTKTPDLQTDVQLVSRAAVPASPSKPMVPQTLAAALLGGTALAIVLAFAAEHVDNRLRTAAQVERSLGLPTLAMIPDMSGRLPGTTPNTLVADHPGSTFAEALRNLYIELLARVGKSGPIVVVVTSPLADEGKSTVAMGLAAAASTLGHRAVTVDVDLRRPGLSRSITDVTEGRDVVAFLSNRAAIDDMFEPDAQPGALVQIGVHEAANDPGALLSSPRLDELLDQLRQRFNLIVLDAPPILPVLDAKILSNMADATLLVLRWGHSHPEAARVAVDTFGEQLTGAVLNKVDYREHARRGYGDAIHFYSRYASYYREQEETGRFRRILNAIRQRLSRTSLH